MRNILRSCKTRLLFTAVTLFTCLHINAQTDRNNIRSYLFYGSDKLTISSANISGGFIGSYKEIVSGASSAKMAGVYSWGTVVLGNSNTITGDAAAGNQGGSASTTAFTTGSGFTVQNLDSRGGISIKTQGGSKIIGQYWLPTGSSFSGPSNSTKASAPLITLNPSAPSFPSLSSFPATAQVAPVNVGGTITLTPGVYYSNLSISGNTVVLDGPGVYYIDGINGTGNNTFQFKFSNNSIAGAFKVVVKNTALMGKVNAIYTGAGTATANDVAGKIYMEVQGISANANSPAFEIANGASSSKSRWLGTVYTPNGSIYIGSGTGNTDFFGCLWTGKGANTPAGSVANLVINSGVNTSFQGLTPVPSFVTVNSNSFPYDGQPKTLTATVTSFFNETLTSPAVQFFYLKQGETTETNTAPSDPGVYRVRAVYAGNTDNAASEGIGTLTITSTTCTTPITVSFVTTSDFKAPITTGATISNGELICKAAANQTQQWKLQITTSAGAGSSITWTTSDGNFYPGTATTGTTEAYVTMAGTYDVTVINGVCTTTASIHVSSCVINVEDDFKIDNNYDPNNPNKGRVLDAPLKKYSETPIDPYSHFPQYGELPMISLKGTQVLIDLSIKEEFKNRPSAAWTYLDGIGFEALVYEDVEFQGIAARLVTGWVEREKLQDVNLQSQWFNYARFTIRPQTNNIKNPNQAVDPYLGRVIKSAGDSAQKSSIVRYGYGVDGTGIKVGIISDSYDKSGAANPTLQNDIDRGDLPANVNNIKDFEGGTDEGRAMAQLVIDVAPKAALSFYTGFWSEVDMALGILAMSDQDIIVDDITYATAPYFGRGVITAAIEDVTTDRRSTGGGPGVKYFTSAGNFADKAYENTYTPITPATLPTGISAGSTMHNFGTVSAVTPAYVQQIELSTPNNTPASYLIVLQWDDPFYSLGGAGTNTDLDIYLTDITGKPILGYNRYNWDPADLAITADDYRSDPMELLPFSVSGNTTINVMIVNAGSERPAGNPLKFKMMIYRGGKVVFVGGNSNVNRSTIVGHANSSAAMTVAAVRYNQVPGMGTFTDVESFTSLGTVAGDKPDFTAPQGGNTSINMGTNDIELDGLSNFFGTSAAAPHLAGLAALVLEGKKKFVSPTTTMTNAQMKSLFRSSTFDLNNDNLPDAFDTRRGYGIVDGIKAMKTFANPKPTLTGILFEKVTDVNSERFGFPVLGQEVRIQGFNFLPGTELYIRGERVPVGNDPSKTENYITSISATEIRVMMEEYDGNRDVYTKNQPLVSGGIDGGTSNTIYFLDRTKIKVTVSRTGQTKKYGQNIDPVPYDVKIEEFKTRNLTAYLSIGANPILLYKETVQETSGPVETSLSQAQFNTKLADIGIGSLAMRSGLEAVTLPDAGKYPILIDFGTIAPADIELYDYQRETIAKFITINKLNLTITPKPSEMTVGGNVPTIDYDYIVEDNRFTEAELDEMYKTTVDPVNFAVFQNAYVEGFGLANRVAFSSGLFVDEQGNAFINGQQLSFDVPGTFGLDPDGGFYPNSFQIAAANRIAYSSGVAYASRIAFAQGSADLALMATNNVITNARGISFASGVAYASRIAYSSGISLNRDPLVNRIAYSSGVAYASGIAYASSVLQPHSNTAFASRYSNSQVNNGIESLNGLTVATNAVELVEVKPGQKIAAMNGVAAFNGLGLVNGLIPEANRVAFSSSFGDFIGVTNTEPVVNRIAFASGIKMTEINFQTFSNRVAYSSNASVNRVAFAQQMLNLNNASGASVNRVAFSSGTTLVEANSSEGIPTSITVTNPDGTTTTVNITNTGISPQDQSQLTLLVHEKDVEAGNIAGQYTSLNAVTGLNPGRFNLVFPGAFLTKNFNVSYGIGTIFVNKAPTTVAFNNCSTQPCTFTYVYGQTIDITAIVKDNNNVEIVGAPIKIYYQVQGAPDNTKTETVPTNAGTYQVTALFAGDDVNQPDFEIGTLVINKIDPTITVNAPVSLVYDKQAKTASGSVTGLNGAVLAAAPATNLITYSLINSDGTFSPVTSAINVGTYSATLSYPGSTNYNAKAASVAFTITKANATLTITPPAAPIVYTNTAKLATGSVTGIGGDVLVASPATSLISYSLKNSDGTYSSIASPINAGTYSATITYGGNNNYNGGSASVEYSIGKALPTVNVVAPTSLTYDGNAKPATGSVTGIGGAIVVASPATSLISYERLVSGVYTAIAGEPIDAGTYRATLSFGGDGNYQPRSGSATYTIGGMPVRVIVNQIIGNSGIMPAFSNTNTGTAQLTSNFTYITDPANSANITVTGYTVRLSTSNTPTVTSTSTTVTGIRAGTYVVEPVGTATGNYTFVPVAGSLYMNPYGNNIKAVKPTLECVQDIGNGTYRANYSWINANNVEVRVPRGAPDNYILADPGVVQAGYVPQKFAANTTGRFSIEFDGSKTITWILSSLEKTQKTSSASVASSNSGKCGSGFIAAPLVGIESRRSGVGTASATATLGGSDKVYPNPFTNRITIETDLTGVTEKDIQVFDMIGKLYKPVATRMISVRRAELDLSNLINGQYYIRVNTKEGVKLFRIQRH